MTYDDRIEIRMPKMDKQRLKEKATEMGLTLSAYIYKVAFLNLDELPPTEIKKQRYAALDHLSAEINAIGKNINQLIPVLRGIAAERKIEDGEYRRLLEELRKYNAKRVVIAGELYKYMFE